MICALETSAVIFMVLSWGVISALTLFCYARALRKKWKG